MARSQKTTGKTATALKRKRNHENRSLRGIYTRSRSELFVHRTRSGCARPDPIRSSTGDGAAADDGRVLCRRVSGRFLRSRMATRGGSVKDLRSHRVFSPASISRDSDSDDGGKERVHQKVKKSKVTVTDAHCAVESGDDVAIITGFVERDATEKREVDKELGFVDVEMESENGSSQGRIFDVLEDRVYSSGVEEINSDLGFIVAQIDHSNNGSAGDCFDISERGVHGGCPEGIKRCLESADAKKGGEGYLGDDNDVELQSVVEEIDEFIASFFDGLVSDASHSQLGESCMVDIDGDVVLAGSATECLHGFGVGDHISENASSRGATGGRQSDSGEVDFKIEPVKVVDLQNRGERIDKQETDKEEFAGDQGDLRKLQRDDHSLLHLENSQVVDASTESAVHADQMVNQEEQRVRTEVNPPSTVIASTPNTLRRKAIKIFHQSSSPSYRKLLPFLMNLTKDSSHDFDVRPCLPTSKVVRNKEQKEETPLPSGSTFLCFSNLESAKEPTAAFCHSDFIGDLPEKLNADSHVPHFPEGYERILENEHPIDNSDNSSNGRSSQLDVISDGKLNEPITTVTSELVLPCNSLDASFETNQSSPTGTSNSEKDPSPLAASEEYCRTPLTPSLNLPIMSKLHERQALHICSPQVQIKGKQECSPPSVPSKGILKIHRQLCSIYCRCGDCSAVRLQSEKASKFSQKQMQAAENLVLILTEELSYVRSVMQKSVNHGLGKVRPPTVIGHAQATEICRRVLEAEETAREGLRQMARDLSLQYRVNNKQREKVKFSDHVEEKLISEE